MRQPSQASYKQWFAPVRMPGNLVRALFSDNITQMRASSSNQATSLHKNFITFSLFRNVLKWRGADHVDFCSDVGGCMGMAFPPAWSRLSFQVDGMMKWLILQQEQEGNHFPLCNVHDLLLLHCSLHLYV
eukprot:TRINITY_DN4079_c0_g1_i1.p1 TRINITY_DN4079_c0_g1~~TRINITY_DN4079_c0_g1_i1.p1  ORF type:complete len:130 (+),score=13.33 TRINITY_DN4079_c0_g1_i1:385-774(+)